MLLIEMSENAVKLVQEDKKTALLYIEELTAGKIAPDIFYINTGVRYVDPSKNTVLFETIMCKVVTVQYVTYSEITDDHKKLCGGEIEDLLKATNQWGRIDFTPDTFLRIVSFERITDFNSVGRTEKI